MEAAASVPDQAKPPGLAGDNPLRQEVCPGCGYSLLGLPADGVCPECGQHYGRDTVVLFGRATGQRATLFTGESSAYAPWLPLWLVYYSVLSRTMQSAGHWA